MRLQQGRPSRWRPADRGAHREDWTGPSSTESDRPTNNLSQYGSPDYVFGKTTIPFNVSELPAQPIQGRRAEMDGGRAPLQPGTPVDRSNLPPQSSTNGQHPSAPGDYDSFIEAHEVNRAHTETRPRRRNDSMSGATTSRHRNRPSNSNRSGGRPTRTISMDEQATMKHPQPIVSSGVPDRSRTESAHAQSEARRRQRTRPLPDSRSSSESDSAFSPKLPSNKAPPPPQSDRPRGNDDSDRRYASTTSTATYQPRPRRQSSGHGNRDRDRPQSDPPTARPQRHSVSGRRDEGGVEQQALLSSVQPPISSYRRRRSSRSSSGHKERVVD
jgi:hypothetical protein